MKAAILYEEKKGYNGIKEYSQWLYDGLSDSLFPSFIPIKSIEIKIGNKRLFGDTTKKLYNKFMNLKKYDIVHQTSFFNLNKYADITTVHDIFPLTLDAYKKTGYTIIYYKNALEKIKKLKAIIVPSNVVKKDLESYIDTGNVYVIPTGIPDLNNNYKNPYPDNNKMHLVTVGSIYLKNRKGRKRIEELFKFVKQLPDVELYQIGNIDDPEYVNYSENIINLGFVDEYTKYSYLKYADKYVYYTYNEGEGFPAMEAMKLNTQVLVNDIPVHHEILGDKAYYFNDFDEFIDNLYKPKKPGLVEQISQYDNWIEKYIKIYNEIVK